MAGACLDLQRALAAEAAIALGGSIESGMLMAAGLNAPTGGAAGNTFIKHGKVSIAPPPSFSGIGFGSLAPSVKSDGKSSLITEL